MIRVQAVTLLGKFRVRLLFTDGKQKIINLEPFLRGPIFDQIRNDPKMYQTLRVDNQLGTIVWDNGADIDPDVLVGSKLPAWMKKPSPVTRQKLMVKESVAAYRSRKKK